MHFKNPSSDMIDFLYKVVYKIAVLTSIYQYKFYFPRFYRY